ncbi:hypothetical protein TcWFU_005315 [Taenia crassiceps]|uniref:Uncharacterized protein n=1 Tax=Taenia crassiceps TaxID=6207 RepID=A0ABR4QB84_9CEST
MTTAALQLCRRTTTKVPGAAKDHDSSAKNHQRRYDRVLSEGRHFCLMTAQISHPCHHPTLPITKADDVRISPFEVGRRRHRRLYPLLISRLDRGRVGKRAEPPLASLGLPGQSACTKWCIIHLLLTTKTRTKPEHKQVTRGPTLLPPYLPPLPPTPPPPPLYPSNYSPLPASPPRTTPYDHLQQHSGQQQQTRKHRRPLLVHSRINVFHTFSASPSVKASERIPDLLKSPFTIKQHLEVLKQEDPPFPPDVDGMMRLL